MYLFQAGSISVPKYVNECMCVFYENGIDCMFSLGKGYLFVQFVGRLVARRFVELIFHLNFIIGNIY